MTNLASEQDRAFRDAVESCAFPVGDFDHRAHVRLAYTYLVELGVSDATDAMRKTIIGLLKHVGVEPAEKYHETLTEAWILAVHHFMECTEESASAADFINQNQLLLDSKIMLTHYSTKLLFSDEARKSFVEPDLDPIPRHGD